MADELKLARDRYNDEEKLRATFRDAGVDTGKPLVVSCGTGVTACVVALALDQLPEKPKASACEDCSRHRIPRKDMTVVLLAVQPGRTVPSEMQRHESIVHSARLPHLTQPLPCGCRQLPYSI